MKEKVMQIKRLDKEAGDCAALAVVPETGNNLKRVKIYLTGHPLDSAAVFMAGAGPVLNCGRAEHVLPAALTLRRLLPDTEIILCTSARPSELAQIKNIARLVRGRVAAPIFDQANRNAGHTTFYQLLQAQGLKAVINSLMVEQGRQF